ncbi:unnamed protein product [Rotaria sp. Silwood1]|nr:unnamed protein product [Rotaria sp. Silwood1]CAF5029010.1 unnamed protein product [Rotaria sp. Silwood1]
MLSLLVLCLIGLSTAQVRQPCVTLPQWEARIYSNNQQQNLTVGGRLSYDSIYHRARLVQEVKASQEETAYDIISLFEPKVEFLLNLRTRQCTRREIDQPWRDFGIQADAKFLGEAYISSSSVPSAGLLITISFVLPKL